MIDLAHLLMATDADTLKNDGSASGQVSFASEELINAGDRLIRTVDVTVGQAKSSALCFFENTRDGPKTYGVTFGAVLPRTGRIALNPASYEIYVSATRIGANTVRFSAFIPNPYGTILITALGAETFTFTAKTIVEPF